MKIANCKLTLDDRLSKALELRTQGYNCAQAVALAFDDIAGLDAQAMTLACMSFGSGVSCGEICGAASGMALVAGSRLPASPAYKIEAMKITAPLMKQFSQENGGRIRCADLKGKEDARSCNDLICHAIRILHSSLERVP